MKKVVLGLIFTCALALGNANAQSFEEGDNVVNLTIGFGSGLYNGTGYSVSPAIAASMEHCFWDDLINGDFAIGVGGYFGFQTSKQDFGTYQGGMYGYRYTSIIIAGRGALHWTGIENFDTYGGLSLGGNIASAKYYGPTTPFTTSASGIGGLYLAPYVGARYYFTDAFSGVVEFGSGIAYFNVGVGFKF